MPLIYIYRRDQLVAQKEFRINFYIMEDEESQLFWQADEEQVIEKRGGEIHIWIKGGISVKPTISWIRPDWVLILNGNVLEQNIYSDVVVAGKEVELHYRDHRFVCSFNA